MSKLRSWIWTRLVYLADRISPEDAFRATGLYIHLRKGEGWVLDSKGVQVWYKGNKEYNEHSHDGYDEAPVIGRTVISTGPGGIQLTADMTPEDIQQMLRTVRWER